MLLNRWVFIIYCCVGCDWTTCNAAPPGATERAIIALRAVGVYSIRDNKLPGRPVVTLDIRDPGHPIPPAALALLRQLPSVRRVLGHTMRLDDGHVPYLLSLPQLEEVSLVGALVTNRALFQLSKHPSLRAVTLFGCSCVTDKGVRQLARSKSLERLSLEDMGRITDRAFSPRSLAAGPRLKSIEVTGTNITDEGVRFICAIKTLESLDIRRTDISPRCLRFLSGAMRLKTVYAEGTLLTQDEVVKALGKNSRVRVTTDDSP